MYRNLYVASKSVAIARPSADCLFLEARRPSLPAWQTQRRQAPRRSRHIADRGGAGGAGGGRSGLTAPSPASGVAVGVVEQQGGQHQGPPPFAVFVGWRWSSGPWCFARRASTGPWAGGRLLTAMYMAPAVGWALPWHPSCLCAGSATARPPPLPSAFCEGRRPINPAPFIRVGKYYRTTIEHKNVV